MVPVSGSQAVLDLTFELSRAYDAMWVVAERIAGELGISGSQWGVLGAVSRGGAVSVPAIAQEVRSTRQGVQKQVNLLRRQRLVTLDSNPGHRRSPLVSLTPAGRQLYMRLTRRSVTVAVRVAKPMSVARLRETSVQLRLLAKGLDEVSAEAAALTPSRKPTRARRS